MIVRSGRLISRLELNYRNTGVNGGSPLSTARTLAGASAALWRRAPRAAPATVGRRTGCGAGAAPRGLPNAAGAEEAERAPAQLEAEQQLGPPARPGAASHELGALDHAAGAGEDQGPGEVGRRVGEHVRRVRDLHVAHLRRDDVHVVVPDAAGRDDSKVSEVFELRPADPPREERNDRDVIAARRGLFGGHPGHGEPGDVLGLEQRLEFGGDGAGVPHYRRSWARRIESSTASARSGLHL